MPWSLGASLLHTLLPLRTMHWDACCWVVPTLTLGLAAGDESDEESTSPGDEEDSSAGAEAPVAADDDAAGPRPDEAAMSELGEADLDLLHNLDLSGVHIFLLENVHVTPGCNAAIQEALHVARVWGSGSS